MAFRLIVSEASDLTTIRVVGRLGDEAVTPLTDACGGSRRPLVLDLSDLASASESGVLLLRRLAGEGVHLLGASRYMQLLLELSPAGPGGRTTVLRRAGRRRRHEGPE